MNIVEARDQNGLDTILKRTDVEDICIRVYFDAYISTNKNIFIVSRGSSAPHIESRGSCTVILDGKNIIAKASKHNVVHLFNGALCKGGIQIKVPIIDSAEKWLEHYGVKPIRGVAVLYKAVDEDFSTNYARAAGIFYIPGEIPVAPDWDGGQEECGGGLHLCAHPGVAKTFNDEAKHFIACPVKVSDIVVHYPAKYPEKIKVPKIFRAVYEVNEDGEKL